MYKTTKEGLPTPTANLAINNSRIKLYSKKSETPTYYLQKGQEFQIELHNPTKDTVCAKISLNGKPIAQGGLVLKPAQRVFLDRYIDVAKRFKFDTYEVKNTSGNRKAIEDNGDIKVEFYKEAQPEPLKTTWYGNNRTYTDNDYLGLVGRINNTTSNFYDTTSISSASNNAGEVTLDSLDLNMDVLRSRSLSKRKTKKSIETGRVEKGSTSDQSLTTVYMNWESLPFHSIEYKMLPISQKVNTVQDISIKRYCTNCAHKHKPNFKFCPSCGTKI